MGLVGYAGVDVRGGSEAGGSIREETTRGG